jgi:PKHD-type hydroxylase
MAFQSVWWFSELPEEAVDLIERDLEKKFDKNFEKAGLYGGGINLDIRNSSTTWIPDSHWIHGLVWHYLMKANRENFLYDVDGFDGGNLQYTRYEEGQFYTWHNDADIEVSQHLGFPRSNEEKVNNFLTKNTERMRKLSVVLQLSSPHDYEGGNLQLMTSGRSTYFAPRTRGAIIVFDSRASHRVLKVTKGVRKSIVGWAVGPRWR